MIVPLQYVHAGIGAATLLMSIPLILRRVPMNRVYGIRTRKAFTSDDNWYALNAFGGWMFAAFGLFLVLFAYATRRTAPPPRDPEAIVYFVLPLLAIIPVILAINAYGRRLPDR